MTRIEHIVRTPGACGGKPRIAGTRIRVLDIAYYYNAGWTVDNIAEELEITPGQIHAALSYYFDHKAEIDDELRQDAEFAEQAAQEYQQARREVEARMMKRKP